MNSTPRTQVALRVKEHVEALKFFVDVLGFTGRSENFLEAPAELPGISLLLFRDDQLEALHGPGASRHRVGVGVEFRIHVENPTELATRVRERGGFLVRAHEGEVTVRDGDGYVFTFVAPPRSV